MKGDVKGSLFVKSGIFQAIGVISFGNLLPHPCEHHQLIISSFRLPYVLQNRDRLCRLIPLSDHNSLLIYGSLKKPTMDRFAKVTHYSTGISMLACLVMALAGFLTFGDKTKGNVLNNFPADNVMVNVARLYVPSHTPYEQYPPTQTPPHPIATSPFLPKSRRIYQRSVQQTDLPKAASASTCSPPSPSKPSSAAKSS